MNQKFDLILSFANIEHVYDPKGYLLKCKELLTKNGRIIIQSVNFKSPSSRKLYQEDIPFHLNFFNIKCLEDFCNAHNLEIKKKIFNTKLYHDYSEGYFVERILSFFGKKYSQELRDECGFNTPYKDINRLLTYKYSFTKFRYKILFLLDYTLNKITKIKLNYQFIVILKNKF